MIPIFPLPNVVLFPNVFLPLHIFESRYRDMVRDALTGDRIIGMVLLREMQDTNVDSCSSVYSIGCAGLITHCEQLKDGRYNIVLRGLHKFRILHEDRSRSYRQAQIETIEECLSAEGLREARQRLDFSLEGRVLSNSPSKLSSNMADGDLINALSQYLEFEPIEKQALLERNGIVERCRSLSDLLEIQSLTDEGRFPATHLQ